jgi:hypothetical protein
MYLKSSLSVTLFASFALAVACGGGEDSPDATLEGEPMATAEPPAEPRAEAFSLGGGTATEVHPGEAGSPHVKVDWVVNNANISIAYGRPYLKGRVVGESVEPMSDQWWRLGADEATTLTTDTDLMLGATHVPAGEYTLFAKQMGDEFHLILNSETGQGGLSYNPEHDLAHIPMEVAELDPPAEQLTLSIAADDLGFEWGQMAASVSLMVH